MRLLKCLLISLALFLVITMTSTKHVSAQSCNLLIECAAGYPDFITTDNCIVSSNACNCENSKARTCRIQQGTCFGHNVIWQLWTCDSIICPCQEGGVGDGEW